MRPVIQVDRLSKQYRLGSIGGRRLVDDLNLWWARVRGKENPLSKVGQTGVSLSGRGTSADSFHALRDVSFEVNEGEVLGIIGRNGAGKSTLLKILSRIMAPSSGEVRVKGRIASLLEVGTGFHPELTGRENVYLNGAILGMTKAEIRKKFDEIVQFSGVERFIDTPVKRYSSGMLVRLAFAVAAHLEPEILIVDEVLAVGDQEFQTKCVGKMKEVAGHGRTVLCVSHNMASIQYLCTQAMLLHAGNLVSAGDVGVQIQRYHELTRRPSTAGERAVRLGPNLTLTALAFEPSLIECGGNSRFAVKLRASEAASIHQFILLIYSSQGSRVGVVDLRAEESHRLRSNSSLVIEGEIEHVLLVEGTYHVGIHVNAEGFKGDLLDLAELHVTGQPAFRSHSPTSPSVRGFVEFQSSFTCAYG